jgi:hypothetical protein
MDPNRPKDDDVNRGNARDDRTDTPAYEKPALTDYGSLARLTRNAAGTLTDAKGGKRMV